MCEECGMRGCGKLYMVPLSKKETALVCEDCFYSMLSFSDDDEEPVICDCCGEPCEEYVQAKDGTAICRECAYDNGDYDSGEDYDELSERTAYERMW